MTGRTIAVVRHKVQHVRVVCEKINGTKKARSGSVVGPERAGSVKAKTLHSPRTAGKPRQVKHVPINHIRGSKIAHDDDYFEKLREKVLVNAVGIGDFISPLDQLEEIAAQRGKKIKRCIVLVRESTAQTRQKRMMELRAAFCGEQIRAKGWRVRKRCCKAGQSGKGPGLAAVVLDAIAEAKKLENEYPEEMVPVVTDSSRGFLRGGVKGDDSQNDWYESTARSARWKELAEAAGGIALATCLSPWASSSDVKKHETNLSGKAGRPAKYVPGALKRKHAPLRGPVSEYRKDHTIEQTASKFGIPVSTIGRWTKGS